jgi:hypothetical protein
MKRDWMTLDEFRIKSGLPLSVVQTLIEHGAIAFDPDLGSDTWFDWDAAQGLLARWERIAARAHAELIAECAKAKVVA